MRRPSTEFGVTTTRDRVQDIVDSVQRLTGREILVGIPAASAMRKPEPGEKGPPIDNATIGYIMESGSPAANIPARPFLVPGIRDATDKIAARLQRAAAAALEGSDQKVQVQLDAAGLIAQSAVQAKITDGPFVPLAPATIAKRRSRKPPRTGTKPLIDTGQLRRAVKYVIRDAEES